MSHADETGRQIAPLANVDLDRIIDRLAKGEYQSHIARSLGVSPQALHQHITKHPGYRQALKLRNMSKLDKAQENIEDSAESLDLARAREEFRAAAWRAERECPEEWGQKTEVKQDTRITVTVQRFSQDVVGDIDVRTQHALEVTDITEETGT